MRKMTKAMKDVMNMARREGGLVRHLGAGFRDWRIPSMENEQRPVRGVTTINVNKCVRAGLLRKIDDDHVKVIWDPNTPRHDAGRPSASSLYISKEQEDDPDLPMLHGGRRGKRLAALDPGIAWFGVAIYDAELRDAGVELDLLDGACIRTVKSNKKRKVSVADDDFHRAKRVSSELRRLFVKHDVGMLVAEERSFPRGTAAVKSMAGAWCIIAALSDVLGLPVVVIPPKQIKLELCGREGASKSEVEAEVVRRFPIARGIAEVTIDAGANNNHFFDAAAAGICGVRFDEVLAWLRGA